MNPPELWDHEEGEMAEEEQQDFSKLDTEDLVKHKNWKARVLGYENLAKELGKHEPEDAIYKQFAPYIKTLVQDQNAAAHEKGLEAAYIFIDTASSNLVGKICGDVVAGIVGKCFTARPKQKEKGVEIILLYFELEKQEPTLEELIKGLSNKSPKVVSGCMNVIRDALRLYGPKIVPLKTVLKNIPPFLEDRDKSVREEARAVLAEIYRWIGETVKSQLQNVKPPQMGELEAEFEKHKGVKAVPEKLVRSEQAKKAAAPAESDAGSAPTEAEEEPDEAADTKKLDLIEPREILKDLNEDFYNKLQSKKWQERKEALEMLDKLSEYPKLAEGDYGVIVSELKKIVAKDSNVIVIALAGKCLASIAKGVHQRFSPYSSSCVSVILEKFKEKKSNVVTAMRDAIDACFLAVTLEAITETVLEGLGHKTPSVKSETTLFLTRCFCKFNPEDLPKKQLKIFAEALIKNSNDPDQSVRDSAFEALGTAMKVVGEKPMGAFLTDGIDELKMKKIQEYCEKAVITAPKRKKPAAAPPKPAGPPAGKPEGSAKSGAPVKKVVRPGPSKSAAVPKAASSETDLNEAIDLKGAGGDSVGSQAAPSAPKGKAVPGKKAVPAAKPKAVAREDESGPCIVLVPKGKQQRSNDEKVLKALKWSFTTPTKEFVQQLQDQMSPCFSVNMLKWMSSDDFKNHIKAIDALQNELTSGTESTLSVLDLILKWFTLRFYETNPTVLMKAMEYLFLLFRKLAEQDYKLSDYEASSFIPYLLLKSGEPKEPIREKVRGVVRQLCSLYAYSKIYGYLADGMKSKNARQRSECLDLATGLVEADGMDVHGPNAPSQQAALKFIASLIGDKDAAVRNAALNNLLVVYQLIGDRLFKLVAPISEKDRSMLDERIKRAPKKPVQPKAEPVDRAESQPGPRMTKTQSMPVAAAALSDDAQSGGSQDDVHVLAAPSAAVLAKTPVVDAKAAVTSPEKQDVDRPSTVTLRRQPPQLKPVTDSTIKAVMSSIVIPQPSQSVLNARQMTGGSMSALFSDMLGNSPEKTLAALKRIDDTVSKDPNNPLIADNILGLYRHLIDLLTRMHNHAMSNYATNANYITSCYTRIFHVIRAVFDNQKYADLADAQILTSLLYQILPVLLDKRMEMMHGGQEINKLVNAIILRIVDNANRTMILCASIRLLRDLLGSGMLTDKILELGIKVVWRCVRRMPDTMLQLNLDPILLEVHLFLKQFPTTHWQTAANDTPFRTVKTIVYTLTKMFGAKVLDHLSLVDDPQSSELVSFLKRVVKAVEREAGSGAAGDGIVQNGFPVINGNGNMKAHEDTLSNIMERVGSSENETVQQGLRELYEYKETHKINLDGFLERTSVDFQKFVQDGLRMIEFEEKALGLPESGLSEKGQGTINRFRGVLSSPYITAQDVENIRQSAAEFKLQVRNRCFDTAEERVQAGLREADINMMNTEAEITGSPMPASIQSPSRPPKLSDENSPSSRPQNNLDAVRARVTAFLQKKSTS